MEKKLLKTPFQVEQEQKDLAVYNDYNELMAVDGNSKTQVNAFLMEKYGIHSESTIYVMRKRVVERLQKEGAV